MNRQQKILAAVAVGAVVLYLIYRWQTSGSASSTPASSAGPSSSDYAGLAGQQQSDVAALQGQNSQLFAQEQSDVQALQGSLGALGAQQQSDVSGLTGAVASLASTVENLAPPDLAPIESQVAAIAIGQQQLNRAVTSTIPTHRGGPFYKYYTRVTGHPPPAKVQVNNFVYQAWKAGVGAAALQAHPPHNSAPQQTQVAHPNPSHNQHSNVSHRLPPPRRPPPRHRPRRSGRRR